jgi:hypothetical protein
MLGSWLILRWALKQMDPNRNAKQMAKERKKELARRLGRPVNLDGQYEDVSGVGRQPLQLQAGAPFTAPRESLPAARPRG